MTHPTADPMGPLHPILACTDTVEAALKAVADVDPVFMRTTDKEQALEQLARVETQLAGLKMRVLASADDVAAEAGAKDAAAWLAHRTHTERGAAWAELRLGDTLQRYYPRLQATVADGRVNTAQARVIVRSLAELPEDLDPDLLARAEETLIGYAESFAPKQLRALGRKILDVVAPEVAEEHEATILENEVRAQQTARQRGLRRARRSSKPARASLRARATGASRPPEAEPRDATTLPRGLDTASPAARPARPPERPPSAPCSNTSTPPPSPATAATPPP